MKVCFCIFIRYILFLARVRNWTQTFINTEGATGLITLLTQFKDRQLTVSEDMEHELKSKYAILANNGIEQDSTDSDSVDDGLY